MVLTGHDHPAAHLVLPGIPLVRPSRSRSAPAGDKRGSGRRWLQVEVTVDLAAVANRCDGDNVSRIVYRVDDPVVTDPRSQPGPVSFERRHVGRAWLAGKTVDRAGDGLTGRRIELAERSAGAGPDVDGVDGHAGALYRPSSALTCSQGTDSPGSSIAASASAASSAS